LVDEAFKRLLGNDLRTPSDTRVDGEHVLLEEPETLEAELLRVEVAEAKAETEKRRPGLAMLTDGSRLDSGSAGYLVVRQNASSWAGIETHMGNNQVAYDAELAALARVSETATRRQTVPERATVFTDAQSAAIKSMASEESGLARCTHSRQGSTPRHCGAPDRASTSRSGGA